MKKKPISPGMHGLIDYAFGLALMTVPSLLSADRKTKFYYNLMGTQTLLYGSLTKQPYALAPLIPLPIHKKIDIGNLVGLAMFTGCSGILKRRSMLTFHLGMTALGLVNVLITNWKKP